jgi:hypothetical protein
VAGMTSLAAIPSPPGDRFDVGPLFSTPYEIA